jgi:hypothetical protein
LYEAIPKQHPGKAGKIEVVKIETGGIDGN